MLCGLILEGIAGLGLTMAGPHKGSRRHSCEVVTYTDFGSRWICLEAKGSKYVQEKDTSLEAKATPSPAQRARVGKCRHKFSVEVLGINRVFV